MAAKKAPAKKTRSVGSANAAEKRMMDKKAQSRRTDAAGRSGMGESAKSNVSNRDSLGRSPANKTARAAEKAAGPGKGIAAYNKSMLGASYYATGGKSVPKNATLMSNNTKKKKKK
jgi:hypothetical protein